MRDQLFIALTCELFRTQLQKVEADLDNRYTDGGRVAGVRQERIVEAFKEAYGLAEAAIESIIPG